ncbi:DUF4367 domain-containing protein [Paenibacillus sp. LHD-117]|uniref:DUF4367 domain-containing protein n=1 Tax=Paenibacillus sp. LHD-117 TaxID=3071412 RepID=UPI0027E02C45|nr:DUF4367 domain-containing protein [Paenibacillus sp. LHD-117]MDQ6421672.1 DUF4367 domain-containing protein [Paenibacillus sp. LHD-117]
MQDIDRNMHHKIQKESDDILFTRMELSEQVKQKIRQQAAAETGGRRFALPKSWIMGAAAALVAAVILIAGLQQPSAPGEYPIDSVPPTNEGTVGSELSQLVTTSLASVEEARSAFGEGLLVPSFVPEGFALSEMAAVGLEGEPARDVLFTYNSGEKTVTFSTSRMPAVFPQELFSPTQVGGADGYVFEQPELVELYWMSDGVQYGIVGNLSAEDAMKLAESATP